MLKNIVILIFFLLSALSGKDIYIFDSPKKDNHLAIKQYKKEKKDRKIVSTKIKPAKEITLVLDKNITKVIPTKKKKISKNLTQLLKLYKKKIDADTVPNKSLFLEIREKFINKDSNLYDTIALINALEDIQNKKINKYEALLTIESMIEEIK